MENTSETLQQSQVYPMYVSTCWKDFILIAQQLFLVVSVYTSKQALSPKCVFKESDQGG